MKQVKHLGVCQGKLYRSFKECEHYFSYKRVFDTNVKLQMFRQVMQPDRSRTEEKLELGPHLPASHIKRQSCVMQLVAFYCIARRPQPK
jgi:hypothetical protein